MLLESFKISLIAFVFVMLTENKMIFSFYKIWLLKLPEWISFPLGLCYVCFTGQVCLWYYLIFHFKEYNFIEHLFFISAGIMLSHVYKIIHNYADR
jgi:hypothetical protein